jgi:hypothetical protein
MVKELCDFHKPIAIKLSQMEFYAWIEKREHRPQRQCPICRRWLFRDEFGSEYKWRKATPSVKIPDSEKQLPIKIQLDMENPIRRECKLKLVK